MRRISVDSLTSWRMKGEKKMKCPKCGSDATRWRSQSYGTTIDIFPDKQWWDCQSCNAMWTDWQQTEIDRLQTELDKERKQREKCEGLSQEIEEHPHCKLFVEADPGTNSITIENNHYTYSDPDSQNTHIEGHRCCAEIARKWRDN